MNICYTQEEYDSCRSTEKLSLRCDSCNEKFFTEKRYITRELKNPIGARRFCSKSCAMSFSKKRYEYEYQNVTCLLCNKQFQKQSSEIKKTRNNFCSKSCAATYNNTHKTHGTRRSKLEVWLEQQLPLLYPSLEFHFNRKDAINAELDIYIPSLKLAFELNGIFHYEPIYGPEKLAQIQTNDERKYQACLEKDIELCLIDVSSFSYFKLEGAKRYLNIVTSILNENISKLEGGTFRPD